MKTHSALAAEEIKSLKKRIDELEADNGEYVEALSNLMQHLNDTVQFISIKVNRGIY